MSHYLRIREFARKMRRYPTDVEENFWKKVQNRQLYGLKFNRQHIIACPFDAISTKYYIADFYCAEFRLIVELDGQIHEELFEQDLIRTGHMEIRGFKVIRFKNEEILQNWSHVCEVIQQMVNKPSP